MASSTVGDQRQQDPGVEDALTKRISSGASVLQFQTKPQSQTDTQYDTTGGISIQLQFTGCTKQSPGLGDSANHDHQCYYY
ncbi:hypothetical protein PoB_003747800 [Plakobranchus ocellatus]|uniref:Uncharacterized protein n=1 Tax=Plakobranchus ocellatus TaxID=259542 RepID=A0AAV4AUA4_9GAST|nr:hypothetical protein PoB_003747800 [Plakobranchus ocellatus]